MPVWDLANRENWELITSERLRVVYRDNTQPTNSEYKYTPISPIYGSPQSHTLLVGVVSASARQHWFLGARVSQYLYVSPSQTSDFISGVQAADIKRVGLNRLTLVEFKNYNVIPYVLQLEIPYWLEDAYVEVWQYQGYEDADSILAKLKAIEADLEELGTLKEDLERIEAKIDNYISPAN